MIGIARLAPVRDRMGRAGFARQMGLSSMKRPVFASGSRLSMVVLLLTLLGLSCNLKPDGVSAQESVDNKSDAAEASPDESPVSDPGPNPFPGRFPAPGLEGGTEWLNTSGEISLKELRGKIVLLDFWTYCCINCMHILPDLKYLEQKYPNQLVVIGVHHPKFDNERDSENIREAIVRYEIEHPVVNDSDGVIGRKFQFSSWPTLMLIDPEGNFVGQQPGEGNRELFDAVIGKMITYHRAKGTLDETPVSFHLERDRQAPTPLRYPGKVLADEAGGRLFISDSNHNRLVIASLDGKLLDTIGTGAIGRQDGNYDAAEFDHPQGMALVGDSLYVADTENHLLRIVNLQSRTVTTLAGTGEQSHDRLSVEDGPQPRSTTPLNSPWALQHLNGVLYICMAGPHQLWSHEIGSDTVQVFAGTGREDIIDDALENAALAQPSGITTDGTDLFHVDSEGSAVRRVTVSATGEVTTVVGPHDLARGRSLFEFGDVDDVANKARLQHPLEVLFHAGGLYVADTYNHKLKHVDLQTQSSQTWLGTGVRGTTLTDGMVQLSEPAGLTVLGDELIIADTNNHRILAANFKTRKTREVVIEGLSPPSPPQSKAIDSTPVTPLPTQAVVSGKQFSILVEFELPKGFKLNSLAPVTVKWSAVGGDAVIDQSLLTDRQKIAVEGSSMTIPVTLTGTTGTGEYEMVISYSFCRDGTGGVCRFGKVKYKLPLSVSKDTGSSEVKLTIQPE